MFELADPKAVMPTRSTVRSAGYDLTAVSREWADNCQTITYDTGIKLKDIPEGFFAAVFPRSSIVNYDLRLANSVGVIDADYGDTIKIVFDAPLVATVVQSVGNARIYNVGDKIGQLVFLPMLIDDAVPVTTERVGGFGSSDKRGKERK